jgi:hypothetical protein
MGRKTKTDIPETTKNSIPVDGNTQKDPKTWVTGNEPMTGAQRSYLHTLGQETGNQIPDDLTKAEASEKIGELKKVDPRIASSIST